jgi:hypothetical protein
MNFFHIKKSNGSPAPRFFSPLFLQNKQAVEAPRGLRIEPCFLPDNVLTVTGTSLAISHGNTVQLPVPTAGATPAIDTNASIPASVFGTDTTLLATPAGWFSIPGVPGLVFPGYAA